MHKSWMTNGKIFGLVALLSVSIALAPMCNQTARADTKAAKPVPVLVSGTVKQYFVNRAGYISALSLKTASGTEMVHFSPSWAKRLLADSPVDKTLDGWVITHQEGQWAWSDLVSIGKEPAARVLKEKIPSGAQQLDDNSWIWKKGTPVKVQGKLKKIIVDGKGDVLALVLDSGALVRVPRTVRNEELGAYGTDAIAPLFKDVEVTAWGAPEWQASGDVSIYNQHLATTGLSINGKTVSAIGIPRFPINETTLFGGNMNLINASAAEIVGADGEYAPFGNDMAAAPIKSTIKDSPRISKDSPHGTNIGHAMLQTKDGKYYEAIHQGIQVFAVVHKDNVLELPLVKGTYVAPSSLSGAKLIMVMDDGRQFDMSSSDGKLYVNLPDGNKSPVQF